MDGDIPWNITVSQDRYGQEILWSFRSNCRKYIVETARGHKDEAHQEPIVLGEPVRLSDRCIGLAAHSGIPATVTSKGTKVHAVWGEATDPKVSVPGVPTFVVTYDRQSKQLGKPVLVEFGTEVGRTYVVQYSEDLRTWQTGSAAILGTGGWQQWRDTGPPVTDSLPGTRPARFCRLPIVP